MNYYYDVINATFCKDYVALIEDNLYFDKKIIILEVDEVAGTLTEVYSFTTDSWIRNANMIRCLNNDLYVLDRSTTALSVFKPYYSNLTIAIIIIVVGLLVCCLGAGFVIYICKNRRIKLRNRFNQQFVNPNDNYQNMDSNNSPVVHDTNSQSNQGFNPNQGFS